MKKSTNYIHLLKDSFNSIKLEYKNIYLYSTIIFLVKFIFDIIAERPSQDTSNFGNIFILQIFISIISSYIYLGFLKMLLNIEENKKFKLTELALNYKILLRNILYAMLVISLTIPLFLLVFALFYTILSPMSISPIFIFVSFLFLILSIFLYVRISFTNLLIVDKNITFIKAVKTSWSNTKDIFWKVFLIRFFNALLLLVVYGFGILFMFMSSSLFYIPFILIFPILIFINVKFYKSLFIENK